MTSNLAPASASFTLRASRKRCRTCTPARLRVFGLVGFGLALLFALPGTSAYARTHQKRLTPVVPRIAQGQVVNGAGKSVEGAVVYLENPISLSINSYLTDAQGHFHFTQLQAQTDYEVWAEQNGVQSKHKFISQFSSHNQFNFTLKLTPEHKKLLGFL